MPRTEVVGFVVAEEGTAVVDDPSALGSGATTGAGPGPTDMGPDEPTAGSEPAGAAVGGGPGGTVVGAGGAGTADHSGASPVPNFHPSTSPSCTWTEPAPAREYVNDDVPLGARK